jgi:hypothetical protein
VRQELSRSEDPSSPSWLQIADQSGSGPPRNSQSWIRPCFGMNVTSAPLATAFACSLRLSADSASNDELYTTVGGRPSREPLIGLTSGSVDLSQPIMFLADTVWRTRNDGDLYALSGFAYP